MKPRTGLDIRLPTEAQWEYAARAGTTTRYHYGDDAACDKMNYENDPGSSETKCVDYIRSKNLPVDSTVPVKSYAPNQWGIYDMHGNVWEWCSDWYGDYPEDAQIDPPGPSKGSIRVFRGGSWYVRARFCRSAIRDRNWPDDRNFNLGFRLVLPPAHRARQLPAR